MLYVLYFSFYTGRSCESVVKVKIYHSHPRLSTFLREYLRGTVFSWLTMVQKSSQPTSLCWCSIVKPIPHEPWAIYHPTIIRILKVWFRKPSAESWGLFAQSFLVYRNVEVRFIGSSLVSVFHSDPMHLHCRSKGISLVLEQPLDPWCVCVNILSIHKSWWLLPRPSAFPLRSSQRLLFLKWYKSDNWVALRWGVDGEGDLPSGWILLNGSVSPPPSYPQSLIFFVPLLSLLSMWGHQDH